MERPPRLNPVESDAAYAAARCVVQTHERLVEFVREGQTLAQIDTEVARILKDLGGRSCFLGYRVGRLPPFPSHACLSVNDCIVHGTAGSYTRPIASGDLLSVDIGVLFRGWVGDAAWTYGVKAVSPEDLRLMRCGKESLRRGIEQIRPGNRYEAWARAVQTHVEKECGFHCVRGLGGHGYGRKLHGPPFIANTLPSYPGEWPEASRVFEPGVLIAVEPMIGRGTGQTVQAPLEWPIHTADGSKSVHYEADVLVTDSGPRDLTDGMASLPELVG